MCGIGSTGRICAELAENFEKSGDEVKIAYGRSSEVPDKYRKYALRIGSNFGVKINALKTRLFDNEGFNAKKATKRFLMWADDYNPDLIWLHNLHGYYINIELLFDWIKSRPNMQVKWTLHDCWAFTGHCTHFTVIKCEKWQTQCINCPQRKQYPKSLLLDNCKWNYNKKKNAFIGVKNMTLITPSKWLADLVRQSILSEYPVEVLYNTIDTNVFKPTPSNFRKKYGLENKIIVLGVAGVWTARKGLDDFVKLSKMLDSRFVIVLVGLTKKQIRKLPNSMMGISRTNDVNELATIYTAADLFVNPSKEETFGMTTMESLSCGTKPIVYKNTASEEVVQTFGGLAVNQNVSAIYSYIKSKWGG